MNPVIEQVKNAAFEDELNKIATSAGKLTRAMIKRIIPTVNSKNVSPPIRNKILEMVNSKGIAQTQDKTILKGKNRKDAKNLISVIQAAIPSTKATNEQLGQRMRNRVPSLINAVGG